MEMKYIPTFSLLANRVTLVPVASLLVQLCILADLYSNVGVVLCDGDSSLSPSTAVTAASSSSSNALSFPGSNSGFLSRTLSVVRFLPALGRGRAAPKVNQGCVGGTKCQFFVSCWMSGGSLGQSCGPLSTCCITPSSHDIQPGFYGPVVNDPCECPHRHTYTRKMQL